MKVLIRHRDEGTRKMVARLAQAAPEFEWVEWLAGQAAPSFDGVEAVVAVGPVDAEAIAAGRFRLIQTLTTGWDQVDLSAAAAHGVMVANMPASRTGNAESVAELTVLLMLALSRRLDAARGAFQGRRLGQPVGIALQGKSACIVGLGDVGSAVARCLAGFGMRLSATRRNAAKGGPAGVAVRGEEGLFELLGSADFVILCARAGADNRGLYGAAAMAATKKGAVVINVARGSLVDHDALLNALQSGQLGGAGLDVFPEEPADPEFALYGLPNVIATPHIGGVTDLNLSTTLALVVENLRKLAAGGEPEFLISLNC